VREKIIVTRSKKTIVAATVNFASLSFKIELQKIKYYTHSMPEGEEVFCFTFFKTACFETEQECEQAEAEHLFP